MRNETGLFALIDKGISPTYTIFSIKNLEESLQRIFKESNEKEKERQEAARKNVEFFLHLPIMEVQKNFTEDEIWLLYLLCRQAHSGIIYTGHRGVTVFEKASHYIDDRLDAKESFYFFTIETILSNLKL